MRITEVRTYIPQVGSRLQCIVKVETDAGIVGWGESGMSAREEAVAAAVGHYRDFLIGADPMARGAIWQRLYRSQYFEGGRVLLAAQSAIDIALYDIAGKALGVPVYELLGGKQREFVPLFATTGAPMGPGLIEDAQALIAEGWDVIRLHARQATVRGPGPLRATRIAGADGRMGDEAPRGGRSRADAGHRLPPSPVRRRGRQLLSADAAGHARLPRGADPRGEPRCLCAAPDAHRRPARDRRGVLEQVVVRARSSSAGSQTSSGSTSATSAGSRRR